jgi:DNA-binding NarL/FixJ family response regulator
VQGLDAMNDTACDPRRGLPPWQLSVLLADDHQLVRQGVRRLVETATGITVVAEASNGHEVLDALRNRPVDVAVLDLSMPGMPGMDLIRRVKADHPQVAVLVLTMHAEEPYVMRAFRCGANGYLTKDSAADELVHAIRRVAAGGAYVAPAIAERLAVGLAAPRQDLHRTLSDREFEVLRLIVAGQRLTDIAQELHLSVKTVSTHKSHILDKLQLTSTASLVRYALEHRLFDDSASVTG